MPVSESGLSSPVDQLEIRQGSKSPSTSPKVQQEYSKSKVSRQDSSSKKQKSISKDISSDEKLRRQMHKQESKDSGIVTEMYTRPKEFTQDTKSKKASRSSSMKSSRTGSVKNKGDYGSGEIETEDKSEIELLTPKQNGSVENEDQEKSSASIKTMWKKAFKSLKTSSAENKLTKKASFIKKKQRSNEEQEPEPNHSGDIDPVYSLLKCAADLPKAGKSCGLHPYCSGHHGSLRLSNPADSSGSTSKTSSPSSSGMQDAVANSLGSEFKSYYKLTSPMKKSASSPFDFF